MAIKNQRMASVKTKDTLPELTVRRLLFNLGYRYRLHDPKLPGKPDIVLSRHKKVIFVNGCFWHGHYNCKRSKLPKSNTPFWIKKINKNKERDQRNLQKLYDLNWSVLTLWECEVNNTRVLEQIIKNFFQ